MKRVTNKLGDIYTITSQMLKNHKLVKAPSIDEIFEIDKEVRIKTNELIKNYKKENKCLII